WRTWWPPARRSGGSPATGAPGRRPSRGAGFDGSRASSSGGSPILERSAFHDPENDLANLVILGDELLADRIHGAIVVGLEASAEGVGQQVLDQAPREPVCGSGRQQTLELPDVSELTSPDQLSGRIDREAAVLGPPSADRVVILQGEAQGIHRP